MATQITATVLKIGTNPLLTTSQQWSFPTDNIAIEAVSDGDINSMILFAGTKFYVSETEDALVAAANAGGGSVTIGGTYDDNATALAALGTGKLYKSSTLINGSPIILITV